MVAKRCAKAKKLNRDNGLDKLLNKDSGYEKDGKYGVISNHATKSSLQQQGRSGPITEAIMKIISIVFDLFSLIVYDFRENHIIMVSKVLCMDFLRQLLYQYSVCLIQWE